MTWVTWVAWVWGLLALRVLRIRKREAEMVVSQPTQTTIGPLDAAADLSPFGRI